MGALLVALSVVGLNAACGTATVVQCRVEAVEFLPRDPAQLTAGDVTDLVGRLRACDAVGDAGR